MQKREKEIVELDVKVQKLEKDKEEKVIYVYIHQIYSYGNAVWHRRHACVHSYDVW